MSSHQARFSTVVYVEMEKEFKIIRVNSFVRGYHAHMEIWEPDINDENPLKREPNNIVDENAVAVVQLKILSANQESVHSLAGKRTGHPNEVTDLMEVVGHVPKLMAVWLTKFLKRPTNSGKVVITGKRVNRGGGYGLELPCEYVLQGDLFSCNWLNDKLINEGFIVY